MNFVWDKNKDKINQEKHNISFNEDKGAFFDNKRIITYDRKHSTQQEPRYFCFGKDNDHIVTVRFTIRKNSIRIYGAGYWREGVKRYEKENKI